MHDSPHTPDVALTGDVPLSLVSVGELQKLVDTAKNSCGFASAAILEGTPVQIPLEQLRERPGIATTRFASLESVRKGLLTSISLPAPAELEPAYVKLSAAAPGLENGDGVEFDYILNVSAQALETIELRNRFFNRLDRHVEVMHEQNWGSDVVTVNDNRTVLHRRAIPDLSSGNDHDLLLQSCAWHSDLIDAGSLILLSLEGSTYRAKL